ncbi:MAG: hypothetical protein JSR32_07685 [Proteobacteria bacterium]|nr:hypothetical protein [Pseudomonadota bacterium]
MPSFYGISEHAMDEKNDSNGNVGEFWVGDGPGMPSNLSVVTPLRLTAARIKPTSCTQNVKISVSIANICEFTGVGDFSREGVVDLSTFNTWVPRMDRVSATDDGPASFTCCTRFGGKSTAFIVLCYWRNCRSETIGRTD